MMQKLKVKIRCDESKNKPKPKQLVGTVHDSHSIPLLIVEFHEKKYHLPFVKPGLKHKGNKLQL